MSNVREEKLREASCVGDLEAVRVLLAQNVDVNARHPINGWTALHWACKRGNEEITRVLLNNGADANLVDEKGDRPGNVTTFPSISTILGESVPNRKHSEEKFVPNYIRNAPLGEKIDVGVTRIKNYNELGSNPTKNYNDLGSMPTTNLPARDDLVLKIRVANGDPDFIEVEIPRWKLTYTALTQICCEELNVLQEQVERIRKLPNTRLRNDSDVQRLTEFQSLELVLKGNETNGPCNGYESISRCDQTILY